ncbi:Bug family tripartite tricarboxylate transporter substrate binding protein [Bordetella bronchialis]|nr:tripartite tricarboxylate transporter substrate-binding protein [Bordetella bronchialis]
MWRTSIGRSAIAGLTMLLACGSAPAADTTAPIRLIVPTPPGSASDALARAMSAPWGKASGRAIVVENVAGAGTTIGTRQIARAPKDGLTLGVISSNHTLNPWLYKNLPYDPIADFTPIAMIGSVPAMLVANNSLAANTPAELVQLSKSLPKPLAEGVVTGTAYHMASEVFKEQAGLTTNPIPYKGSTQVINDLIGGNLDIAIVAAQAVAPLVAAGKLKGLAVTSAARSDMAPQLPTLRESGLPKYDVDVWLAIAGPGGLSSDQVAARRKEIETALADPDMKNAMQKQGVQPVQMEQARIAPFMQQELERNRAVIQRVGISVD